MNRSSEAIGKSIACLKNAKNIHDSIFHHSSQGMGSKKDLEASLW